MGFSCCEAAPGVRHIGDGLGNFCTLLTGTRRAVLFDTMMGLGDLRGFVESLCPLPLTVICSHGHFDHVGGSRQFGAVGLHPADLPLLALGPGQIPVLERTLERPLDGMEDSFRPERFRPVLPGRVLDLGGMTAEVVDLSGHTPGSIGLLCRERRLLLVGDGLSPQMCLLFPESLPLDHYARLLDRAEGLSFDRFLAAHFSAPFSKDSLDRFRDCIPLVGKGHGMDYVFGPLPYIRGQVYVSRTREPETGQLICLIVKPGTPPLGGG